MKKFAFAFLALMSLCLSPFTGSAETLDEPTMKAKLSELFGDKSSWIPASLKDLKRDMPCEDAKKIFTAIPACDATKEYDLINVPVQNSPILEGYLFNFQYGKLYSVNYIFQKTLDKELFKKVSLEAGEAKWGALEAEKKAGDVLTWMDSSGSIVQRSYKSNQWQIKVIFPR